MTTTDDMTLEIGDRVESGGGDDHDTGRIIAIDGDRAEVAWRTGVRTWQPLAMLSRIA